jgi:hypothetical protein
MEVPKFVIDVAAGTISGTIVTCIPLLLRRTTRQPAAPVVDIDGDNNHVHVDQSQHEHRQSVRHTTITVATPPPQARPDPALRSQFSGDDVAVVVIGAIVVFILLLFAWPFVLGLALGSSVVISWSCIRTLTRPTFTLTDLRIPAIVQSIATVIATIASSTFTLFAPRMARASSRSNAPWQPGFPATATPRQHGGTPSRTTSPM